MGPTLSRELAEFVADLRGTRMSALTVDRARLCVLDWLGSVIAGSIMPPGRIMLAVVEALGDGLQSTLVPSGRQVPVTSAALYNGATSHVVELDDVHRSSIIHPAAPVIPAALAVGEMVGTTGLEFLAAVVAGYEVAIRIGEAVTPAHYRYWHTTGTCGTFGAAAAAARLLRLDAAGIASALGSAGTQAAGLWEFLADGAMSKHLHPGKAAANGVLSALLAREGFTAASRILEGDKGFFRAMAATYDESRVTAGLGNSYKIMEVSFKIHASCRHTHASIDMAVDLLRRHHLNTEDIASVLVETYSAALDITADRQPATVYKAKFSLPFCVALALCRGKAGLSDFTEETLHDADIRGLMDRVELSVDPDLDVLSPARWPARVTVRLKDGRSFAGRTDYPRGDPENPVTAGELEEKFEQLASPVVGETLAQGLTQATRALEGLPDVRDLTSWFRRDANTAGE